MPQLSLCMIVRDEAATLRRAISSFDGLADEVIVVDTGSTDDTPAVAAALGATVIHHAWQDDFSIARMAGFERAAGQWVFVLDADEHLLPESRDEVRRLTHRTTAAEAFLVTRRDVTAGGTAEMLFVRLARRDLRRRMIGRIHERVEPAFSRIERSSILLEHDGYQPGRSDARLRRNVRLLELELADHPNHPYFLADLTHSYWFLKDPRFIETLGKTFAAIDTAHSRPPIALAAALLELALATPAASLPSGVTHPLAESLAGRWYPNSIPLLAARARLAFLRNDFAAGADLALGAIQRWASGQYDRSISFDPQIVGPELHLNVGVALARTSRLAESLPHFERAAQDPRFAQAATQNAAAVRNALAQARR